MERLVIGPSTGWLYAKGINSLIDQKTILEAAGANVVEFCVGVGLENTDMRVASMIECDRPLFMNPIGCGRWEYRSLHLPDYKTDCDSKSQLETARRISVAQMVDVALIHPLKQRDGYPVHYYNKLQNELGRGTRILLAIENMDKRKPNGFLLPELVDLLLTSELRFVLDVQHAFEHDSSMHYAWELFQAMRSRLVHLHVSGESEGNNHCLLYKARNASIIVEFLGKIFSKVSPPIILEGEYKTADDLRAEIEFIKKELGVA